MNLVVFGANGGIGKNSVEQALAAGHRVTAVVRRPASLTILHERLEIVKGDVFEPATFESSIAGADAVISALGAANLAPTTVNSTGIANIIKAMQAGKARRL